MISEPETTRLTAMHVPADPTVSAPLTDDAPSNEVHPIEAAPGAATDGAADTLRALYQLRTLVPQLSLLALTWLGNEGGPLPFIGKYGGHG